MTTLAIDFLTQCRAIVGVRNLISDPELLRVYECDALEALKVLPQLVVLPESIAQVQDLLKLCSQYRVPVVPRGAGTGLTGGSLAIAGGVMVVLSKMQRILAIDPDNRTAQVQAGVRNIAISEAAKPYGLYYAPDPSSQIACSIGGNIAQNSGGVHCLKYGLTVHNIIQVKLVTMAGELLTFGSRGGESPGYGLLPVSIGSEGLLGIVVEATVRLLSIPPCTQVLLAAFASIAAAGDAVAAIIASGVIPAGLELMDNAAIRVTDAFVQANYPIEAAAILLCELDGLPEQVAVDMAKAQQILVSNSAIEIRIAQDAAERKRFWAGRKAAFPAVGRIAANYYCMDGTIPRKRLAEVLTEIDRLATKLGLSVVNVFHAGDGNLHPLILYDAKIPGDYDKAESLGGQILELCVQVGGTITGEHGVGIEKLNQMCVQFSPAEIEQFQRLKLAFDGDNLLNPDKAIPSLHRCAEFGGFHVHQGQLPHPELERF